MFESARQPLLLAGTAALIFMNSGMMPAQTGVNLMNSPYRMLESWGSLPEGVLWGATIGIIPDGQGGAWVHHRSDPPIIKLDASGKAVKTIAEGMFVQAHGFCMDRDGNLWAGDSGPFGDEPSLAGRGYQFFKFSPRGELLLTLGKAGISKAGPDTFIAPTACAVAPNGDIFIADGHFPRPSTSQQDGDRIVRFTKDGKYVNSWGRKGSGPGEFDGPHALAFDSQGRLFVADRNNNRIQVFDRQMRYLDDWRHFGRPSGLAITSDDALYVSDSESGKEILGVVRNPGWKNGVRIGSAKDGSLTAFIDGTDPEGLGVDDLGNVFAGLTREPRLSPPLIQKWVKK
jgi:sugar lactone lactonase YvrE